MDKSYLRPLNGEWLLSWIVFETSFAIIVSLKIKNIIFWKSLIIKFWWLIHDIFCHQHKSMLQHTHSRVVFVVELVHEIKLNSVVHDLCNEVWKIDNYDVIWPWNIEQTFSANWFWEDHETKVIFVLAIFDTIDIDLKWALKSPGLRGLSVKDSLSRTLFLSFVVHETPMWGEYFTWSFFIVVPWSFILVILFEIQVNGFVVWSNSEPSETLSPFLSI